MSAQYYLTDQHATDTHRVKDGKAKCGAHVVLCTIPDSRAGNLDNCPECYGYPRFDRFVVAYWNAGVGKTHRATFTKRDDMDALTRKITASGGTFAAWGLIDGGERQRIA